jgi:hypothetical protein
LVYGLLGLMDQIFCTIVWLDWFSMRLGFVVVYSIGEIEGIVGYGIGLAYFLVLNLVCCLDLGLCYCLGI